MISNDLDIYFGLIDKLHGASSLQLEQLTQTERRYCLTALSTLESFKHGNSGLQLNPENKRLIQTITSKLSTPITRCARFILRLCALSHNNCRVSSRTLQEKVKSSWINYLRYNAEVVGNLEEADYIFLGDSNHLLDSHNSFRCRIIERYGNDGDIGLEERSSSRETNQAMRCLAIEKKITWSGWDDGNLTKQLVNIYQAALHEQRQRPQYLLRPVYSLSETQPTHMIEINRNDGMIDNIRKIQRHAGQKVFIIAGSGHLIDRDLNHNMMERLKDLKCAMVIPIVTETYELNDVYDYIERGCALKDQKHTTTTGYKEKFTFKGFLE